MIIARDCHAKNMALVCFVADQVCASRGYVVCLADVSDKQAALLIPDILTSERVTLLKDLTASLGAGVSVEWSDHRERIEIALTP